MSYSDISEQADKHAASAEMLAQLVYDTAPTTSSDVLARDVGVVVVALVALTEAVLAVERRLAAGQARA